MKINRNLKIPTWVLVIITAVLTVVVINCYLFSKKYKEESSCYTKSEYTDSVDKEQIDKDSNYKTVADKYLYEFIDSETGVHYWIYSYRSGYGGGGMTPRLNSDGSIMVD